MMVLWLTFEKFALVDPNVKLDADFSPAVVSLEPVMMKVVRVLA